MLTKFYKTDRFVRAEVIKTALAKHFKMMPTKVVKAVAKGKAKSKVVKANGRVKSLGGQPKL